jgi:3D (Asp-Asp-Asp) domain-containing protein
VRRIRAVLLAVIVMMAAFAATAASAGNPPADPPKKAKTALPAGCTRLYTIDDFVVYGKKVYKRDVVRKRSARKVREMKRCQHSTAAKRLVHRYHKRFIRDRAWLARGSFRGHFVATAYGPPWGGIEGGGITATGVDLPNGVTSSPIYIIAIDDGVLGPGSGLRMGGRYFVWPNPYGYRGCWNAQDRGGAIVGNRLDFLVMDGRARQNGWGRRTTRLYNCRR